jgi:ABC-type multidrug transport system ATPase subunit
VSAVLENAVIPLGACYRMLAPTRPYRDAVLRFLAGVDAAPPQDEKVAPRLLTLREAAQGSVAIAFDDGGLLQWLDAWQNAVLPSDFRAEQVREGRRRARGIFAALGQDPDRLAGRAVADLSLFETRLVGFVKAMLLEADLLVLDGLLERLGLAEQRQVCGWIDLYRRRYPLRRTLYLGLHAVDGLDGFVDLEAA